jgi:acetoin utilization deacetylase AcuC-like enzyme
MRTALIYHPIFLQHDTGSHHPERPSRLQAILRKLQQTKLIDELMVLEPEAASIDDIALVHSKDYIFSIRDICSHLTTTASLDPDTIVSRDSFDASLFAAGAVIKGVDLVFDGEVDNAFCMVRPPGHHARPSQAMGFCIFNNIAIGARYIQERYNLKRILIIDWDVHHGNGTEEIFYEDPSVFYISLHQYPHYPGTGAKEDIGVGKGKGFNLNIPMQSGSGDREYIEVFKDMIVPKAVDFKPEFILISAGFDGHRDDSLSSINLTEEGYSEMTHIVKEIAKDHSKNRIVSVLEGGYNLFSLQDSVYSHLEALL